MNENFKPLVETLTATATAIIAFSPTEKRGLNVVHQGWSQPAIGLPELAEMANSLVQEIQQFGLDELDETQLASIADWVQRIEFMRTNTIPQVWGGNGVVAVPAYIIGIQELRRALQPLLPQTAALDPKAMPVLTARRIKRLSDEVDAIIINRDLLKERMSAINDAYEAAESLPENLDSLREARDEISKISKQISKDALETDISKNTVNDDLAVIHALREQAAKLVDQCEEAYRITTSKGLAGAFESRAEGLAESMKWWVGGLVAALIIAASLGYHRVDLLSTSLAAIEPKWGAIWLNFILSLLSVGAPLWFAWVATKQIGQRFKLAEDYAYKASISKAYEGYRREASSLDPNFMARLFSSSLTRLEEAPMRLLEPTSHGSPLHEFFAARRRKEPGETPKPAMELKKEAELSTQSSDKLA